jgi:ribonuclease HI
MKYVKGTKDHGLIYKKQNLNGKFNVYGYVDSDWASDATTRKSTTGYIFFMNGKPISWNSRKQNSVALSSTEAEYMALSEAVQEALWLIKIFADLGWDIKPVTLYEDNMSCMELTKNNKQHQRTKHIDIRYHFVRDAIKKKDIRMEYIETKEQVADMMTKPLTNALLTKFKEMANVGKGEKDD